MVKMFKSILKSSILKSSNVPPILLALITAFSPLVRAQAQTDPQLIAINKYLSGRRLLVTYREGGAVYGTHNFLDVHYCANGEFILFGRSERQTVLDNFQRSSWEDTGRWEVVRLQGRAGVRWVSRSGKVDFAALEILPDGRLWAGEGVSIQPQGPARCK
jgi:hypothetical protein